MARIETVEYTCDLDPDDDGAAPRRLALDGVVVEIDLCEGHHRELRGTLAGYLAAGRPPARPVRTKARQHARTAADRKRAADIRAWAVDQGLMSADRRLGRLSADVIRMHEAAMRPGA